MIYLFTYNLFLSYIIDNILIIIYIWRISFDWCIKLWSCFNLINVVEKIVLKFFIIELLIILLRNVIIFLLMLKILKILFVENF